MSFEKNQQNSTIQSSLDSQNLDINEEFPEVNAEEAHELQEKITIPGAAIKLKSYEVRLPRSPQRLSQTIFDNAYLDLKRSIEVGGGNVVPIEVLLLDNDAPSAEPRFELISGYLRLQACLDLGLDVLATVKPKIALNVSFEIDRLKSGEGSVPLKPYEKGILLRYIADHTNIKNDVGLVHETGISKSQVSRGLALADLPTALIDIVLDPRQLRFKDGPDLKKALNQCEEAVTAEIGAIAAMPGGKLDASEVVVRLLAAAGKSSGVARCNTSHDLMVKNQKVGCWQAKVNGETDIRLSVNLSPSERSKLMKKWEKDLGKYVD